MPLDTANLKVFAAQPEAAIPTELETDAKTAAQCLSLISYQMDALASLCAKHGKKTLTDAMGDRSEAASAVFASFGAEWTADVEAKSNAMMAPLTDWGVETVNRLLAIILCLLATPLSWAAWTDGGIVLDPERSVGKTSHPKYRAM